MNKTSQYYDMNYAKDDEVELQVVELSGDKPDLEEVQPLQIIEIEPEEILEVSEHGDKHHDHKHEESEEEEKISDIKEIFENIIGDKDSDDKKDKDDAHNSQDINFDDDLFVSDLPGAPPGTQVVVEEPVEELEVNEEELAAKDNGKKNDKWDLESIDKAMVYSKILELFQGVPKHSGLDSAGIDRAISYLEKLDAQISKLMRSDLDEELDSSKIEKLRSQIDAGVDRLHKRKSELDKSKKSKRKKKADLDMDMISLAEESLVKEAGTPFIKGTYVVVPLLISRLARLLINSTVSAGKDLDATFQSMIKKWSLTPREQVEVIECLANSGFYLRQDRGYGVDDEVDTTSEDNFDLAANYPA